MDIKFYTYSKNLIIRLNEVGANVIKINSRTRERGQKSKKSVRVRQRVPKKVFIT